MSRVRLYVDEDASERSVVDGLIRAGIDVLTAEAAGNLGVVDDLQLQYAASDKRAIYTLNTGDFARLHTVYLATRRDHSGILVIPRQRYRAGEKFRRLLALISSVEAEDLQNQLRFL
jgi:hypothetical protein